MAVVVPPPPGVYGGCCCCDHLSYPVPCHPWCARIARNFTHKVANKSAKEDWITDLNRHNKGGTCLNHAQFSNAMFELVDLWCMGAHSNLMYIEFLRMLFLNITTSYRKKGFEQPVSRIRPIDETACLATSMDNMRDQLTAQYAEDESRRLAARKAIQTDIGEVDVHMRQESSLYGSGWAKTKQMKAMLATFKAFHFDMDRLMNSDEEDEEDEDDGNGRMFSQDTPMWKRVRTYKTASDAVYTLLRAVSAQDEPRILIEGTSSQLSPLFSPLLPACPPDSFTVLCLAQFATCLLVLFLLRLLFPCGLARNSIRVMILGPFCDY